MRTVLILVLALVAAPLQAADTPEALLARMKAWLEPAAPVTRRLAMTVRSRCACAT